MSISYNAAIDTTNNNNNNNDSNNHRSIDQLTFPRANSAIATTTTTKSQLKKSHKINMYAHAVDASSSSSSSPSLPFCPPTRSVAVARKSLLTLLYCSFVIIFTASLPSAPFIALANCDRSAAKTPLPLDPLPRLPRRSARSAIYANPPSSESVRVAYGHLAAYGLRTKQAPQQFYLPGTHPDAAEGARGAATNDLASLNLVEGAREDICKEHCECSRAKNAFITIRCDYQENRKLSEVFGRDFKVPTDATSIRIKLAASTSFRLVRGFFSNNTVNSLIIEGAYSAGEQVEITTEAFQGNNGPFPEINMINVFAVFIRERAFAAGNGKFTVRHCNVLVLYSNAFENAKINGQFVGIQDLRIEEKAFNLAQAKLRIETSNIDNIYRFEAKLREIRFVNCTIGAINNGTFDVITINSIVFENCRIDVIKANAITEKLYSNHVSITNAIIGSIESEAIAGSGISELILTNNKIDTIHENAIFVTAINATIARNNIKHLGNNWLRVKEWSNIIVEKNQFGVFGSMMLEEPKQPLTCRFDGNSLTHPLPGSLNITNPNCILREISVNIQCRCNLDWLHELSAHDLRSETYCTIDDKLSSCFNATTFNTLKFLNEVCDEKKTTVDCGASKNLKKINGRFFTPEELERNDQRVPKLIYIVAGSVLLLALAVIAAIVAFRFCNKTSKAGGGSSGGSSAQSSNIPAMAHINDHLHEFSAEDRHVIAQTMQLMQKKYPEIYKGVNERTQLLLSQRNLSDKKCVKVISQIVNLLNKVESAPDDFVAFNRVLTQHLQPQSPSAPPVDPIYTEPGLTGDFYTSSTIVALPTEGYVGPHLTAAANEHNNSPEHIYAEPNCAQQPLLRNEYASPADRNIDSMDLYTEPINERETNMLPPTAYAVSTKQQRLPPYATPVRNQHQKLPSLPSILPYVTSSSPLSMPVRAQNLPDVLYQSQHTSPTTSQPQLLASAGGNQRLTNVKKIAQDLQNMPKFHLNLPATQAQGQRNFHLVAPPVYTAPDLSHKQPQRLMPQARLASPEVEECDFDMRGAAALPPDSNSDHSGGSNETVKIDDVIRYADADA